MEPSSPWPEKIIEQFGHLPIWTVTWQEYYIQHQRHLQTFAQAEEIARGNQGQVILPIRQYACRRAQ